MVECRCGCGNSFEPSRATLWRIKKGMDVGYLPGHAHRGARNGRWKGGRVVRTDGYIYVLAPEHPNSHKGPGLTGYIREHRLVMSNHLGRPLESWELVHHVNGDKGDNRIENLVLTTRPSHMAHHFTGENNPNWNPPTPKVCPQCGAEFIASHHNHSRNTFCSRVCYEASR